MKKAPSEFRFARYSSQQISSELNIRGATTAVISDSLKEETMVTYSVSSGCFLDGNTKGVLIKPYEWQLSLANKAGINNIELWPINWVPALELFAYDIFHKHETHLIDQVSSFHQSPVVEKGFEFFKSLYNLTMLMTLPQKDASLTHLARMQHIFGSKPTVLYPCRKQKLLPQALQLPYRALQTYTDTFIEWGVNDLIQFLDVAEDLGFNQICIDSFHLRRHARNGKASPFADWENPLRRLLRNKGKQVTIFHLAIGRKDMVACMPSTTQELIDCMKHNMHSEIVHFMRVLKEEGFDGIVTFEVLPSAIWEVYKYVYEENHQKFSEDMMIRALADIRTTCEMVFDQ